MLYYPEKVARKLDQVFHDGKRKKLNGVEVGKALLELEPTFGAGSLLIGMALELDGELEHAEEAYWTALALCPCRPEYYLHLANLRHQTQGADDPVAMRANAIAFSKISMAEKVRPDIVDLLRNSVKAAGSPTNPYTYGMVAAALEQECTLPEPLEDDERMVRYKVLHDLQREAMGPLESATLQPVLDDPDEYAGLLHAALREWANTEPKYRTLRPPALQIFIAILGEIGRPEHIGDLLELADDSDETIFHHAHWALQRLGKRHPDAALQAFRAAAPGAESGMLCALAEQLNLLPPIEGVVPALAALLEEFPRIAEEHDAAYLLAVVTDSIVERDAVDEAHALLSRYRAQLSGEAREWLRQTVEGDEEFTPELIEEDIASLTIQDVCLDGALLSEEEEFEDAFEGDWEDDEDEEFELQPVFTPKVGRNDPCWCGSGTKYKKCHLRQDEEAHFAGKAPAEIPAGDPLTISILKGMDRWHSKADLARSKEMFFGSRADDEHDPADLSAMAQFLMLDFRDAATGLTLIEHYLKDNASRLSAKERAQIESLRDSRFGLYETYQIDKGRGVHMRDVFDDEKFLVQNVTSSRSAELGDCGLLRIQLLEGRYLLAGDGTAIAREALDEMREFVKEASRSAGQGEAEFVRGNSHLLHRHYADLYETVDEDDDDDVLENCTANYEVLDPPALLATLRSLDDIYEEESEDSRALFGWLGEGEEEREINGTIEVTGPRLSLGTTSRKYLVLGRKMLEQHAGRLLKFLDQKIT